MRTLVIDSATEACSVALFDGKDLIAGEYALLGRGHAERLVPMIASLPDQGRAARIAVALGPGSFTGVRVGLAAARALAFAWAAELVGYPTLSLIAAMAQADLGAQSLAVVTTGGHGEWFVQGFAEGGTANTELASMRPDMAIASVQDSFVAGSQAEALVERRGSGRALPLMPDARHFGRLHRNALTVDTAPLYGRPPDAKLPGTTA